MDATANGLIFISHSSADKEYVEKVIKHIPQSHLFYDIRSIDPADKNIDALDDGLLEASTFVLFVSPNTPKSVWVNYESAVAQFQKIKRQNLVILIVPIKGATYKDAPDWMHDFMAASEKYNVSDVARLIKYCFEQSLRNQGLVSLELFVGRETLVNDILAEIRTRPLQTGIPINFVIFAGIQGMGRSTLTKNILPRIFPGSRTDFPVIDLARHADAFELFLALRSEAENGLSEARLRELAEEWPSEDPNSMGEIIFSNLQHELYAEVGDGVRG